MAENIKKAKSVGDSPIGKESGFGTGDGKVKSDPKGVGSSGSDMGTRSVGDKAGSTGASGGKGLKAGLGDKGGLLSRIKGLLDSGFGHGANGIKNLFRGAKSSWFGLKTPALAVSSGIGKLSTYLHLSKPVTAGILSLAIGLGGGTAVMTAVHSSRQDLISRQEWYEAPCEEEVDDLLGQQAGVGGDLGGDQRMIDNANKIWGVLKMIGWSDEAAAGFLGNLQAESGIDETAVEGIYDEHYNINGPKKVEARNNLCKYCRETLFPMYHNNPRSGYKNVLAHTCNGSPVSYCPGARCSCPGYPATGSKTLDTPAYEGLDGHFCCGLGLVQSTGPRGSMLLMYAEGAQNKDWWALDLQMAFYIDQSGGDSPERVAFMWSNEVRQCDDVAEGARLVAAKFVGHDCGADRISNAQRWYEQFKGSRGDATFAQSVISLAGETQQQALATGTEDAMEDCGVEDNWIAFDIARAAVAYAYKVRGEHEGKNGTEIYQYVHGIVHEGAKKGMYMSCDIGVSTAIRWCDADPNFPHAGPEGFESYCERESKKDDGKWEFVGMLEELSSKDLRPGDVLTVGKDRRPPVYWPHGHVAVIVGPFAIYEKWPDMHKSRTQVVSASWQHYSPGVSGTHGGFLPPSDSGYKVWRLREENAYKEVKFRNITKGLELANDATRNEEPIYIDYVIGKYKAQEIAYYAGQGKLPWQTGGGSSDDDGPGGDTGGGEAGTGW